jgi:hypothetical protein
MSYPDPPPYPPQQPPTGQPMYPSSPYPQQPPTGQPAYPPSYPPQPATGQPGYPLPAWPPTYPQQPYPSSPYAPYQTPPPEPPRSRATLVLVSVLVAVVITGIAGIAIIGFRGPRVNSSSTSVSSVGQTSPTATPRATGTPAPLYSAPVPACGATASDWNTSTSAVTRCGATGLTVSNPASSATIAEVFLNLVSFPSSYTLKVHLTAPVQGCAGMAALRDQYKGYDGYICAAGTWKIVRYDSTGHPIDLARGTLAAKRSAYNLIVALSGQTLSVRINNVLVGHVAVDPTYTVTQAVSLTLDHNVNQSASVVFSDFTLTV